MAHSPEKNLVGEIGSVEVRESHNRSTLQANATIIVTQCHRITTHTATTVDGLPLDFVSIYGQRKERSFLQKRIDTIYLFPVLVLGRIGP
jgi:hypothetical protein